MSSKYETFGDWDTSLKFIGIMDRRQFNTKHPQQYWLHLMITIIIETQIGYNHKIDPRKRKGNQRGGLKIKTQMIKLIIRKTILK